MPVENGIYYPTDDEGKDKARTREETTTTMRPPKHDMPLSTDDEGQEDD